MEEIEPDYFSSPEARDLCLILLERMAFVHTKERDGEAHVLANMLLSFTNLPLPIQSTCHQVLSISDTYIHDHDQAFLAVRTLQEHILETKTYDDEDIYRLYSMTDKAVRVGHCDDLETIAVAELNGLEKKPEVLRGVDLEDLCQAAELLVDDVKKTWPRRGRFHRILQLRGRVRNLKEKVDEREAKEAEKKARALEKENAMKAETAARARKSRHRKVYVCGPSGGERQPSTRPGKSSDKSTPTITHEGREDPLQPNNFPSSEHDSSDKSSSTTRHDSLQSEYTYSESEYSEADHIAFLPDIDTDEDFDTGDSAARQIVLLGEIMDLCDSFEAEDEECIEDLIGYLSSLVAGSSVPSEILEDDL